MQFDKNCRLKAELTQRHPRVHTDSLDIEADSKIRTLHLTPKRNLS